MIAVQGVTETVELDDEALDDDDVDDDIPPAAETGCITDAIIVCNVAICDVIIAWNKSNLAWLTFLAETDGTNAFRSGLKN